MPETLRVRRTVKDTVFSSIFENPKYLLQLYRVLHPEDTQATEDMLKIVTIQNVLADHTYNDLGFMVRDRLMVLVEAQSTWSVNIIIRSLLYLAQSYKEYFAENDINLYSSRRAPLPEPELYVVYTGERAEHPEVITLSQEFFSGRQTALDVRVKFLYGEDRSNILGQYVIFCKVCNAVTKAKGYTREAVLEILRVCRDEKILEEYLSTHEKEAFDIMFTLFDDEYLTRVWRKEVYEEGMEKGSILSFVRAVRGVRGAMDIDPEKAMEIVRVPAEYREAVLEQL